MRHTPRQQTQSAGDESAHKISHLHPIGDPIQQTSICKSQSLPCSLVTAAVDTDPCNCSPRQITFKLDFSQKCWIPGLPEGAGAIEDSCTISGPSPDFELPVYTTIHIEEYDETGTKLSYTSYYEENPNSILGGMAVTLTGLNTMNEEITNAFALSYTNECGVPTFQVGDVVGWLVVDSLTPSWHGGCGYPMSSPSASPTSNPTISPSTSPTPSPTASPICNCFPKEISFKKQSMNRSFQNGDIFSYTTSADESPITGTIQLRILAKNILGETIVNQLAIKFSNGCGIPAIEVGDYLGWVIVVSQIHPQFILSTITNPAHNIFCLGFSCSAIGWRMRIFVVAPSISPISVPSSSPTASPTTSPMCNCFPKEISFKFNFSLSCEDTNIVEIAGSHSSCPVHGMEGMVNDYVPVAIEGIDVLQLGIDLNVIHQTTMQVGFGNGEGFLYTAYADEKKYTDRRITDSLTPSSECVYTSSPSFSPTSRSPTSSPSALPSATPTTSTSSPSTSSPSTTEIDDPSKPTLAPTTSTCVFAQKIKIELQTGNPLNMFEVQVFSGNNNIALGMPATQSSTFAGDNGRFGASKAVDGVSSSMSHTKSGANQWWEVELDQSISVPVDSLTIMNRWCGDPSDSNANCLYRMSDAPVYLYDEFGSVAWTASLGVLGTRAERQSPTPLPTINETPPSSVCTTPGRKIKITSITGEYLHMFEVQAWAGDVNIALNKLTTQGSDFKDNPGKFGAFNAVDGDAAFFSHTDGDCVWWEVDLGYSYDISSITIKN
eukprot:scaffold7169_cov76-Cyclotella_meneghiniana.AAC.11